MSMPYDLIRKLILLFVLIALVGLVYSFWGVITGATAWFHVVLWFLVVVGAIFGYVIVFAKGIVIRRRETLAQMTCPSCGSVYGMEAALQARHDYMERWKEAHRHHQNPKDLEPYWHVRCPKCRKETRFQKDTYELEKLWPNT
jgi:predicted RNA-binding Zn-ribbon protein involved in translation (DUF1610 family)